MWFLKKKKDKTNDKYSGISAMKRQIYEDAEYKMELNFLSPKQIEKIIENNQDVDFLDDEIKKEMNFPDLEFIANKLLPEDIENHKKRKDIDPKEVVKAVCLGDIIGYKYEFTPHNYEEVAIEKLPPHPSRFTDDTVLSMATMNAVLSNPDKPDFRQAYIDAYYKHPSVGYGASFVSWATNELMFYDENMENSKIDNTNGYHSFGNGCAMRIAFIPAYYDDIKDVIRHTIESVMVTHNHIESVRHTVVLSVCIWMALHNYTKKEITQYVINNTYCMFECEYELLVNKFSYFDVDERINTPSTEESKRTLYVNYAVPYAIDCFEKTNSYEECMRKILSNFGDTDTLCAIAGGLCYAFYEDTGFDVDEILKDKGVKI